MGHWYLRRFSGLGKDVGTKWVDSKVPSSKFKVPKICNINFWIGNNPRFLGPPLPQRTPSYFGSDLIKCRVIPPSLMAWNPNKLMKCLFVKLFSETGHTTKSDEFLERFQTAVDPHHPPRRMVPISGNHMHAFHTIWPSYLLVYKNMQHNFPKMMVGGSKAVWNKQSSLFLLTHIYNIWHIQQILNLLFMMALS